jgi:hypothetical protein
MTYAVVNNVGVVLARHADLRSAQQEAMFFHAVTRCPYSVVEES